VDAAFGSRSYLRRDARVRGKIVYYAYVLDNQERLLGVATFRDLITGSDDKLIRDVMCPRRGHGRHSKNRRRGIFGRSVLVGISTKMIQKRSGWLAALFLGEMLTATAMGYFAAAVDPGRCPRLGDLFTVAAVVLRGTLL
jgi:magnesium transporter